MEAPALERLIRAHARTMSLTLQILPRVLREPLGLAYLLARASDTIADQGDLPAARRLGWLEAIAAGGSGDDLGQTGGSGFHPAERDLLRSLPRLLALLEQSPDHAEIRALWGHILEGQLLDLRRFVPGSDPLGREELVHYCDLVAGCVGRSWTRLIASHAPGVLRRPIEELLPLASDYGCGLQLLNILRDRVADREAGRSYVREEDVGELMTLAGSWLNSGDHYLAAIRPGRILLASTLPLELARGTLDLIQASPDGRARLPREEVRRILLRSLPSLVLPRRHDPV